MAHKEWPNPRYRYEFVSSEFGWDGQFSVRETLRYRRVIDTKIKCAQLQRWDCRELDEDGERVR